MTCLECMELLQQMLDEGGVTTPPPVAAHLQACPDCRDRYAAAAKLARALNREPCIAVSPLFTARITSAVLADGRRRQRRRWLGYVGSAVAAGLLIAVGLRSLPHEPPDSAPAPVAEKDADASEPVRLRDSLAQARSAMASMTSRTADETVGPARHLLASITKPDWRKLPPMDQPARSLQEVGQGVSAGFEPVTTSAHRAFDMLIHNLTTTRTSGPG